MLHTTDLDAIARTQGGLITRAQTQLIGHTGSAVRHSIATGRWQRILPGVYATFDGQITQEQRLHAAALYAGDGALISGSAACRIAGLRYVPDDDTITVLLPVTSRRTSREFVLVRRTTRMPTAVPLEYGSPPNRSEPRPTIDFVPVHCAVLDLARQIGNRLVATIPHQANGEPILVTRSAAYVYQSALSDVRAVICESVQRGKTTVDDLIAELAAGPTRGSRLARIALSAAQAGCRSAPECEVRDLIRTSSELPEPIWNEPLPGLPSVVPDGRWDKAWLVLEIDSAEWHRFGNAPERTEQRRARIAADGWRVYPVSPRRLRAEPNVVLLEIEAAYRAGAARRRPPNTP